MMTDRQSKAWHKKNALILKYTITDVDIEVPEEAGIDKTDAKPSRFRVGEMMDGLKVAAQGSKYEQPMRERDKTPVKRPDGNEAWGYVKEVDADGHTVQVPIVLQIGFQIGEERGGLGLAHLLHRHREYFDSHFGEMGFVKAIDYVLQNGDVYRDGSDLVVIANIDSDHWIKMPMSREGSYYTIKTLTPITQKHFLYTKKRLASFTGQESPVLVHGDKGPGASAGLFNAVTPEGLLPSKDANLLSLRIEDVSEKVKGKLLDD